MCRPATCKTCGNTTWAGCGEHADEVMRAVPKGQRCTCTTADKAEKQGGIFARLFGC